MRGLAIAVLLTVVALAGCAAKTDTTTTTSAAATAAAATSGSATKASTGTTAGSTATQTGTTSSSTGTGSTGGTTKANHAPVALLLLNRTSGIGPLGVAATVNGTDADGDALTFILAFGDGSANMTGSIPAGVQSHTFTLKGNFTVVLLVSDGKASGNATATVSVLGASGGGALPPPAVFTGTVTGVCEPTGLVGTCTGKPLDVPFTMPASAKQIVANLKWSPAVPGTDLDLYVYDASGTERGSSTCTNIAPATDGGLLFSCVRDSSEEATIADILPTDAGMWKATINPYTAPQVTYTLTITYS